MEWTKLVCIIILSMVVQNAYGFDDLKSWEVKPPKKMDDCPLRYDSVYSWLVKIWNKKRNSMGGHGELLTFKSVLSTCVEYDVHEVSDYKIIGQHLWNLTDPWHLCTQTAYPLRFVKHPKCVTPDATFFNFGVWVLKEPFDIQFDIFPTFLLPKTAQELLFSLRVVNAVENTVDAGCDLPLFKPLIENPDFEWKTLVASIRWHQKCIKLLCEMNPPDTKFSENCDLRFRKRSDGSMICMYPKQLEKIPPLPDPKTNYWYAGAPLVCNGTVHGIASQVKYRSEFPSHKQDFHLVVTFLRVWDWLNQIKAVNSIPPSKPIIFIEDMKLAREEFVEPQRIPMEPYIRKQQGDGPTFRRLYGFRFSSDEAQKSHTPLTLPSFFFTAVAASLSTVVI